ncbi:reverse transcriptase domain-containing protein [Tanacetum coccineum]|uniref:Reverse transcriptase domain-containing protein n=1 Tax=Tanacetum coccineum TaxID=301880 RepID=A0ABQ5EYL4_9ASTR
MSAAAIEELIAQGVADALATYDAKQNSGNGNHDGDGSHNSRSGSRRTSHTTRGCTYKEFLNCQPLSFKRSEGAVGLAHWFEKIESVFHISNSYEMPWKTLMKKMTDSYCLRSDIKKFMLPEESDKVEKYTGGLLDNIQGNVMQADNKRMIDNNSRDNNSQQPPYKRQNVARAYSTGPSEKKEYVVTLPLCNKCKFQHNGPCIVMYANYKRVGHLTRDCRSPTTANNQRTLACFECRNQGHYRSECQKLKNQNRGNQARSSEACGRVYALRGGEADQSSINVEDKANA